MSESLTPAQRRTQLARQAFDAKFDSPEAKSEYFRDLAQRSHERRLTLSGDEAAAIAAAYALLSQIAARAQDTIDKSDRSKKSAAREPPNPQRKSNS